VRLEGAILEVSATAPRPSNFPALGLHSHPPPRGPFKTDEPPWWSYDKLKAAFGRLLTSVRHRSAKNIAPRILFIRGNRVEPKRKKGRPPPPYYVFGGPPHVFTSTFDRARLIYPDKKTVPATRAYIPEFLEDFFEIDNDPDRDSHAGTVYYLIEIGLSLQAKNPKRKPYREKLNAREWARRYNASRRKATKKK
jgi:hypothetical protein